MHYSPGAWCPKRAGVPSDSKPRTESRRETHVNQAETALLTQPEPSCAEQLARFFPELAPLQVAVQLIAPRAGGRQLTESVAVCFSGSEHAIFLCTLPIEFNDVVFLAQRANENMVEGSVVAVQYEQGRKAVAVHFTSGPCEWLARR